MSISRLTKRHTVQVLDLNDASGDAMGRSRAYTARSETLECTVVPLSASDRILGNQQNTSITHRVYFASDPALFRTSLLVWQGVGNNTAMEIFGLPINHHGQNRLWSVEANADDVDYNNLDVTYLQ